MKNVSLDVLPQGRDEPTLLVNIGSDDPTRGDAAGWRGLARAMAKKVGGRVVYADDKLLRATFPDAPEDAGYDTLLARFLKPYNPPEYVFGHRCGVSLEMIGQAQEDAFKVFGINEGISSKLLHENVLVAHHLTPEVMAEEGALFDAQHPHIKTPIISVMLVDPNDNEMELDRFAKKITRVMEHYPEATIYLCASRRTDEQNYDKLFAAIESRIKKEGLDDHMDLMGYKFSRDGAYNPYKGLIARSKHIVVWGDSQSMVSEALYSGKTVYLHRGINANRFKQKEYAINFNALSNDEAPVYQEFEPVNLTDKIADVLLSQSKDEYARDKEKLKLDLKIENDDWLEVLDSIRHNFHRAEDLMESYKTNPDFVRLALRVRGFAIQYFPKFKAVAEFGKIAVGQNVEAFHLLDKKTQYNEDVAYMAVKRKWKIIRDLPTHLRNNVDIAYAALKQSPAAMDALPPKYLKDKTAILYAATDDCGILARMDQSLFKNRDFVLELVKTNPDSAEYIYAKYPKYKKDRGVALALAEDPYGGGHLPERFTRNKAFMFDAVALQGGNYKYASPTLKKNEALALAALKQNICAYQLTDKSLQNSKKFNLKALEGNGNIYRYLQNQILREDPDIAYAAIRNGLQYAMRNLDKCFQDDIDMILEIGQTQTISTQDIGKKARNNLGVMKACLRQDPYAIYDAGPDVLRDKGFVCEALKLDWSNIEYVPDVLRQDRDVAMVAVRSNGISLQYLDPKFANDKQVVLAAIQSNADVYHYLLRVAVHEGAEQPQCGSTLQSQWSSANDNTAAPSLHLDHDVALAVLKQNIYLLSEMGALTRDKKFMRKVYRLDKNACVHLQEGAMSGGAVMV